MKNASDFKLMKSVIVCVKEVRCSGNNINTILSRDLGDAHVYDISITYSLNDLKVWLALLIIDTTPRWIEEEVPIKKRGLSVDACYWFGFILNFIKSSKIEFVLCLPKASCLWSIISKTGIEMRLIIM